MFLILIKINEVLSTMHVGFHVKYPFLVSDFYEN